MAWVFEEPVPFSIVGQLFFSPIINDQVYVIDLGTNFWLYDIANRSWTELASPTYGSIAASRSRFFRTLAVSPDGTKLACCSEGVRGNHGDPVYNTSGGRRVEIYDIVANTWSASKQTDFLITAVTPVTRAIVWEDNDTLWVWCIRWYRTGTGWAIKCVKYTISTDTWTAYANNFQDTATSGFGNGCGSGGAAIRTDLSIVYGGGTGYGGSWETRSYEYTRYVVATDAYTQHRIAGSVIYRFCHTYDRDKVWYYKQDEFGVGDCRQGYVDVEDNSEHDDQFEENTDRSTSYGYYAGIKDDLGAIIADARNTSPRLMATGGFLPVVQTDPATEVT